MAGSNIIIRDIELDDVEEAVALCREEGWATSINTIYSQIEHFGRGTFLAAYKENNTLTGICAVYKLTESISFLDFVIVAKVYRGQGIATRLLRAALERAKDTNIILDANPDVVALYRDKFGFQSDHPMYEIKIGLPARGTHDKIRQEPPIMAITTDNIKEVMQYDGTLHPLGYRSYLKEILLNKSNISLCSVIDGKVNGLLEYSPDESLLNVLYAESPSVAKNLLSALFYSLSGTSSSYKNGSERKILAILPEHSIQFFKECVCEFDLKSEDPTLDGIRMFSREKVENISYDKIYCTMYDVYLV